MNVHSASRTRKRTLVSGGVASAVAVAVLFTTAGPAHAEQNDPCANAAYLDEEASLYYDLAEGYFILGRAMLRLGFDGLAGRYMDTEAQDWLELGDGVLADYYGC